MKTSINILGRILAGLRRIVRIVWPGSEVTRRPDAWESAYVCSEAPLCAELIRRSHSSGR